jgi:hypothetical protein
MNGRPPATIAVPAVRQAVRHLRVSIFSPSDELGGKLRLIFRSDHPENPELECGGQSSVKR